MLKVRQVSNFEKCTIHLLIHSKCVFEYVSVYTCATHKKGSAAAAATKFIPIHNEKEILYGVSSECQK